MELEWIGISMWNVRFNCAIPFCLDSIPSYWTQPKKIWKEDKQLNNKAIYPTELWESSIKFASHIRKNHHIASNYQMHCLRGHLPSSPDS